MQIEITEMKSVDLVTVNGRVDSESAPSLDEALKQLTDKRRHNLVLNLAGVDYMSSAGLRAMVTAMRACKSRYGDVRVSTPSNAVREVMDLAGLNSIFQSFESDAEAVGSF